MAIIIKCASCKARLKGSDREPCPNCGSKEKRYIIDFWPDGRHGKRCQRYLNESIKSLAVARVFDESTKRSIKERRNPETAQSPTSHDTMFKDLIPDYMDYYRLEHRSNVNPDRLEKSFKEREQALNIVSHIIGPIPITHFDKNIAANYQLTRSKQKTRRGTNVKNRTINKELTYVLSYLKWCREKKSINITPDISMLHYDRPLPDILSPKEIQKFIKAAQDEPFYLAFFLVCYTLGFRLSEAKYLRWRDIDRENKTVRAVQKGGSDKIGALNQWLDQALKKIKKGKPHPDDYIFLVKRTGRPIENTRRAIDRISEKAGIKKHINVHMFRHSIATHMMANDTNLRTIQAMLGHKDVSTTQKYTHVVTDNIRNATKDMFEHMRRASR
jgi:integrase/recombinase XerC